MDVRITLIHIICLGWVKNLSTSTLIFDISQFFPSLNYHLLTLILGKAGFDPHIIKFFSNYLIGRKINYFWSSFTSPLFDVNVGVGQDSALSSILLALYLSPFLYILENCLKNLKIPISILSFIDNGLFNAQSKSFHLSNSCSFCSYNVISNFLSKFGLIVEHLKTEVFHFNRSHHKDLSILLPLIFLLLEALSYILRTSRNTLALSSIESSHSIIISIFISTRQCQLSNI